MGTCDTSTRDTALASLPLAQRLRYSTLRVEHKHGLAPPYVTDLLEQEVARVLQYSLRVPPSRGRYDDNTFSVSASQLWNSLPIEMNKLCCLVTLKKTVENVSIEGCVCNVGICQFINILYYVFIFILLIYYLVHVLH